MSEKTKTDFESAVSHLRGSGKAYDALTSLFDEGSFAEIGRFAKARTTAADDRADGEFESVIAGYGAVNGQLVYAYAQDEGRLHGAMSAAAARKITSAIDAAVKAGAPIVGILSSAGAKVEEGVEVLSGYGEVMRAVAAASGIVPQISVLAGNCGGCLSTIAEMTDFVIGTEKSKFTVAPPSVLAAGGEKDAGSMSLAAKNGSVCLVEKELSSAISRARQLLSLLPPSADEGGAYSVVEYDASRQVTQIESIAGLAADLTDPGCLLPLSESSGEETLTALGSVDGLTVGVIGVSGELSPFGARKAARFVSFCDSFSIPLLTLVDCTGTVRDAGAESVPLAAKLAQLASVYAESTVPKVTVIAGRAIGCAVPLLGSKALGADIVYAVPGATISPLSPEAAVEFFYSEKIKAAENPAAEREALIASYREREASALTAARGGAIDDILPLPELRARVASALEMLSSKRTGDEARGKKHGVLPL